MAGEHIWYDLNPLKFTETCFMAQSTHKKKKSVLGFCWMECSINVNQVKLIDYIV